MQTVVSASTCDPLDDLETETVAWCRQTLPLSPMALHMIKAGMIKAGMIKAGMIKAGMIKAGMIKAGMSAGDDGLAGVLQLAGDATMLFSMTAEGREGRNAFVEHRQPDSSRFPTRP